MEVCSAVNMHIVGSEQEVVMLNIGGKQQHHQSLRRSAGFSLCQEKVFTFKE